ncbi:hypothetical protein Fcan01_28128 [Folsomia candida]|uniref:Uncharacterized protein n=1 Tax=Folsomia candida TaxID=158441 RepID=A0A226CUM9_FOLCA|nr:hypothetical protein Fcan01_28128 [Folsomia candida]
MPHVTVRDFRFASFRRPSYKVKRSTFTITLKESEKTPKYRNYMKRENLNLAIATKVKRSTFTITLKESEKTPKYRNYMKRENLNLVCPAKCHPLQLETPERARFTPLGHSYKSETEHFYDNFKGIRENSEIPKLHEKGKPKSCMSCQMPPVTVETPERARLRPSVWT